MSCIISSSLCSFLFLFLGLFATTEPLQSLDCGSKVIRGRRDEFACKGFWSDAESSCTSAAQSLRLVLSTLSPGMQSTGAISNMDPEMAAHRKSMCDKMQVSLFLNRRSPFIYEIDVNSPISTYIHNLYRKDRLYFDGVD